MVTHGSPDLPVPDQLLVERMAGEDPAALHELRMRYGTTAYAVAYGILVDPEDAEQVVGDAFGQAWRQAGAFNPDADSVTAWLGRMIRMHARARLMARDWPTRRFQVADAPQPPGPKTGRKWKWKTTRRQDA